MAINECVKQAERLFKLNAKVLHLFKTLKQNKSCAVVKVCCVAFKLSNDNNETVRFHTYSSQIGIRTGL